MIKFDLNEFPSLLSFLNIRAMEQTLYQTLTFNQIMEFPNIAQIQNTWYCLTCWHTFNICSGLRPRSITIYGRIDYMDSLGKINIHALATIRRNYDFISCGISKAAYLFVSYFVGKVLKSSTTEFIKNSKIWVFYYSYQGTKVGCSSTIYFR